jgi:hypothetical protein
MDRRELMQLCTGIIGGLGIPGAFEELAHAAPDETSALDESYLAKGLTGMARAAGWFNAHWGAAVLAGYYLCKENHLGEATVAGIKKQLDAMIHLQASQFTPFPEKAADKKLIEDVPAALGPAIDGGLRAHGHAVIFASLSTKALRDAPQMAQPELINKLCGLSHQISKMKPEKPKGESNYADTQAMIEATFDSLVRFKGVFGHPSVRRPNFTHMTTHTEALMNLESMGYQDLARAGYAGHRAHIAASVPEFDPVGDSPTKHLATLEEVMSNSYWENDENLDRWNRKWNEEDNPNGYWVAFGHLFKVLYSYHRLIGRIEDKEKVRLCSRILLERYFNPDVQGG